MAVTFFVAGVPKPQPRAKAARIGGFVRLYTPYTKDAKAWRSAVIAAALEACKGATLTGPTSLRLQFALPRPKAHFTSKGRRPDAPRYHTSRPDADNLTKLVMDALGEAGVWSDDCIVAEQRTSKSYADLHSEVGCLISLTPLL